MKDPYGRGALMRHKLSDACTENQPRQNQLDLGSSQKQPAHAYQARDHDQGCQGAHSQLGRTAVMTD
jgi:hypothetical protein